MSLAGRLEDLGVSEILYLVGIARRSGELVLDLAGRPARVLFRTGRVVAVRHPRGSASLGELLVRSGVTDAARLTALERQAAQPGASWTAVLRDAGQLPPGGLDRLLEPEVERLLASLTETGAGSFHFRSIPDASVAAAESAYAGLVLSHGVDTARVGGASRASQGGLAKLGLGLPRSAAKRQATLLVPEEQIALPHPRHDVEERPSRLLPDAATHAMARTERERVAIVAVPPGELRQALTTQLAARGLEVEVAETLQGAEQRLREAVRDARAGLVVDASSAALPGLEVLAFARALDLTPPVIVLLDSMLPASRRALLHERALRLGARHVVVIDPRHRAGDEARRVAEDLAEILDHASAAPPLGEPGAVTTLAAEPADASGWEGLAETPLLGGRTARTGPRVLLPSQDPAEVAREILEAAEAFPRAVLLVRLKDAVRGLAAHVPAGAGTASADILRTLVLPLDGDDFLSRALREGRAVTGPPAYAPADKGVLSRLGRAKNVALLPLTAGGSAIGLLYADDGGTGQALDVAALGSLLGEAAAPLHGALTAAGRRAEARRARLERVSAREAAP